MKRSYVLRQRKNIQLPGLAGLDRKLFVTRRGTTPTDISHATAPQKGVPLVRHQHTEHSPATAIGESVFRLPNSGSATARTRVSGGLSVRCTHCYKWINAHTVQIRFSFDQAAGIADLHLVNPEMPFKEVVEEVQRVLILRAIERGNGVMKRAAEIAGMKYTTFWEMARRLGVAPRGKQEQVRLEKAS